MNAALTEIAVAHAAFRAPVGLLRLYGTPQGLLAVALPNDPRPDVEARLTRRLAHDGLAATFVDDDGPLAAALAQFDDWFAGRRHDFELPLDPRGTRFQRRVWDAVATIPWGATRSYSEIARQIDLPEAVRAVGAANGANPLPIVIPCHRVIGANGALVGYGGGLPLKRQLLAWERGQPLLDGLA